MSLSPFLTYFMEKRCAGFGVVGGLAETAGDSFSFVNKTETSVGKLNVG
jgi:hypothetical protein